MKLYQHVVEQPFVVATGVAALVHSTWSLGTLFSGNEPTQLTVAWFAWVAPAMLIAFALDVGQIATSAELRAGQRSRAKYVTFAVFAIATYYLQWLYMFHHMPVLDPGAGVSVGALGVATAFRDAALWFIPALLPLSTLLYTFSQSTSAKAAQYPAEPIERKIEQTPVIVESVESLPTSAGASLEAGKVIKEHLANCQICSWSGTYRTERSAQNALIAHSKQHRVPALAEA